LHWPDNASSVQSAYLALSVGNVTRDESRHCDLCDFLWAIRFAARVDGSPREQHPTLFHVRYARLTTRDPLLARGSSFARYRIAACIGRGGVGEIYRAWDAWLAREVAIEVVFADGDSDESKASERTARHSREARAAAAISHPNVVSSYERSAYERAKTERHRIGRFSILHLGPKTAKT
jgi:serine/threonine protein kinase